MIFGSTKTEPTRKNAIRKKYTNVKPEAFADYFSFENVIVKSRRTRRGTTALQHARLGNTGGFDRQKNADVAALVKTGGAGL
ncbi:MAG: hypothetical protein L6V93_21820 [Clostridiales bacterium]|nr:MAG: hypothetical protein L6V93_21820 [Clostridiales bacterium]